MKHKNIYHNNNN